MYWDFRIFLSQCNAQMKISFPGLIFAQYKSINIINVKYYYYYGGLQQITINCTETHVRIRGMTITLHMRVRVFDTSIVVTHTAVRCKKKA